MLELLKKYSDLFVAFSALSTFGLFIIAWWQLSKFKNQVRADFLYRISRDLDAWLREHKPAREWVFNKLDHEKIGDRYDKWEFDDYLGFFEIIWSFDKKRLVDKEIVYDLFSDYLVDVYEANDFEIKKIIERMREEEGKSDLYVGVESLYKEMKKME